VNASSDVEIEDRLQAILASPPFQKHALDYLMGWLRSAFLAFSDWSRSLSPGARGLLIGACLLLVVAMIVWIYRSLEAPQELRDIGRPRDSHPESAVDPAELSTRARKLAGDGRFREAAKVLHQAALLALSRKRGLPWRVELADWEWVALLADVAGLPEFTRAAQRVAYGADPRAEDFATCERLFADLRATNA
jgi:hypothetical protein